MTSGIVTAAAEARRSRTDRTEPGRAALERAIVQAVAYADVFDYPLTVDEIQRYLIGVPASRGAVRTALAAARLVPDVLSRSGRYFTLAGRESAVETRRSRATTAAEYWRRAVRYGHQIGNLPFVRMVAVTGALAMLIGRFMLMIPVLAIAGSLGRKQPTPASAGTFPTDTGLFAALLTGVVVIVVGLTYFPVVALGTVVEHLVGKF